MESEDAIDTAAVDTRPANHGKEDKRVEKEQAAVGKALAAQIKQIFYTPFNRLMRFLYTGLTTREDLFVLGTEHPTKFRYGKPDQGVALIQIKDTPLCETLRAWFVALGVDFMRYDIIDILQIGIVLNKCKWQMDQVSAERTADGQLLLKTPDGNYTTIGTPCEILFVFQNIRDLLHYYTEALVTKTVSVFSYPYRGDDTLRLSKVVIPTGSLGAPGFDGLPDGDIRVVLTRGLDWLQTKDLPQTTDSDFLGLRLWSPSGSSLFYMHVYETDTFMIATTRCNYFLLVRPTSLTNLEPTSDAT